MRSTKNKIPVHGWLALDKPAGLTSTQALGKARRLLGGNKVGHGGTLDPLATGILPLAFGEATKLIPYIIDGDKEYEFSVRWGEQRDTDDTEGKIVATSGDRPEESAIRAALPAFIGDISQAPPAFSAIKLEGRRAYDLARAGEALELAPRTVTIYALEFTGAPNRDHATFRVHCGKGMYVRSLARDLAVHLGTCGHVAELRRTRVGPFTPANTVTMPKLEELAGQSAASSALLPLEAALGPAKMLDLTAAEAQKLRLGQGVLVRPQHGDTVEGNVVFARHQGVPVALTEVRAGEFRVLRGFHF